MNEKPSTSRPATMADVGARAGVSRALVSIVFRDQPGASEATRQRVRDAARDIGYAPDQRARLLSRRRSGLLGVQFGVEHPFHGELVEALYGRAEARGFELALGAVAPARGEDRAVEALLAYRCEALILLGPAAPTSTLDELGERLPVVVVARNLRTSVVDVVRTDDVDGARQATEHLVALGHRRIVHIDGGAAPGAAERRRGYKQAMVHAGLADQAQVLRGGLTEQAGAAAATRQFSGPRREWPTAVFAFNDQCALGVLQTVDHTGRTVPADLSVVGYDDSRIARLPWLSLTTVRQDIGDLAERAIARAVTRIETSEARTATVVPPHLIVRGSTGVPA